MVVDTSALIDGRIAEVAKAGLRAGRLLIAGFVLEELQRVADSGDPMRRARGRRGLTVLEELQRREDVVCEIIDLDFPEAAEVDVRLIKLAVARSALLLTSDHNLNRIARIAGVRVLNLNDLANALKPILSAGEEISIAVVREGKELAPGRRLPRRRHHGGRGERQRPPRRHGARHGDLGAADVRRAG